jgi:hypothetical protein
MKSYIESLWLVVHQKSSIVDVNSFCFVKGILVEWKGLWVDCAGMLQKSIKFKWSKQGL